MRGFPSRFKIHSKKNFLQEVKALATACNPDHKGLQGVKLPKPKRAYKPRPNARIPHKQEEKKLVVDIIKHLRDFGVYCGKIKTTGAFVRGRYIKDPCLFIGVPDILAFSMLTGMWWVEVKIGQNDLSDEQVLFQQLCHKAGIKHIVARSVEGVQCIIDPPYIPGDNAGEGVL